MHEARHHMWLSQVFDALAWRLIRAAREAHEAQIIANAAREVDGNSLEDSCIPVYPILCLTYRREDVSNVYPDAVGCPTLS